MYPGEAILLEIRRDLHAAATVVADGNHFAPVIDLGEAPAMSARLVTCTGPGEQRSTDLFETVIRPLVNAERPSRFKF